MLKEAVKSVLRITKVDSQIQMSEFLHLFLKLNPGLDSFTTIANKRRYKYSVSISYFTNIAVRNMNIDKTVGEHYGLHTCICKIIAMDIMHTAYNSNFDVACLFSSKSFGISSKL